jgi:hypothetical protein
MTELEPQAKPSALLEVAAWLDAEYAFLAAVVPSSDTNAAAQNVGMRAVTAEYAALLRQWARTGRRPVNRSVPERMARHG